MAYFARLNRDSIVEQVIRVDNVMLLDADGREREELGIQFCKSLYGEDTIWVQTSYNGTIRRLYAGVGVLYRSDLDAFLPPQPYPSWLFNEQTFEWEAPVAKPMYPEDFYDGDGTGTVYIWDEATLQWVMPSRDYVPSADAYS